MVFTDLKLYFLSLPKYSVSSSLTNFMNKKYRRNNGCDYTYRKLKASNSSPGGKGKKPGSLGGKDVSGSGSSGEGSGLDEGSSSGEGSGLDGSESGDKKTLRHFKEPGE